MLTKLAGFGLLAGLAWVPAAAQPLPPEAPSQAQEQPASGAEQVVGLFGGTCLHFPGDVAGMRAWLVQQHAPAMPPQARDVFLAGRQGQVFDVSFRDVRLALISLDDGGCEAVAEHAEATEVFDLLQRAAQQNQLVLTPMDAPSGKEERGVQHRAFGVTVAGRPMHVLVSTAPPPSPQAVLVLVPK